MSMENKFKKGDKVLVIDYGLIMLQRFAPKDSFPNNFGRIEKICDDGTVIVEFPLEGENHSQSAPYPISEIRLRPVHKKEPKGW